MRDRASAKGAAVGVMTRRPAGARRALINGALIPIMTETMARVTCLIITRMSGGERNLGITSSPPEFNSLKNAFFI